MNPIRSHFMDNGTRWMARDNSIFFWVNNFNWDNMKNATSSFLLRSRSSLFEASSIDETIVEEDVFEAENHGIKYKEPSTFSIILSYVDDIRPIRRILWFIFSQVLVMGRTLYHFMTVIKPMKSSRIKEINRMMEEIYMLPKNIQIIAVIFTFILICALL